MCAESVRVRCEQERGRNINENSFGEQDKDKKKKGFRGPNDARFSLHIVIRLSIEAVSLVVVSLALECLTMLPIASSSYLILLVFEFEEKTFSNVALNPVYSKREQGTMCGGDEIT